MNSARSLQKKYFRDDLGVMKLKRMRKSMQKHGSHWYCSYMYAPRALQNGYGLAGFSLF
jgi:hypothetical protein